MTLTKTQRDKASRLWRQGVPEKAIMHDMGLTYSDMHNEVQRHRELYPHRRTRKG